MNAHVQTVCLVLIASFFVPAAGRSDDYGMGGGYGGGGFDPIPLIEGIGNILRNLPQDDGYYEEPYYEPAYQQPAYQPQAPAVPRNAAPRFGPQLPVGRQSAEAWSRGGHFYE